METTNFVDIVVDEIALEGLDGITLPSLWLRLDGRGLKKEVLQGGPIQNLLWSSLVSHMDLAFYVLPSPRPDIIQFDRFAHYDPNDRLYTHPENQVQDIYEFEGVHEGEVMGSCTTFRTRTDVTSDIRDDEGNSLCSYDEAMERWGRSLVVVASQSVRNVALTGSCSAACIHGENVQRYYLLEMLGRARLNGLTSGTNLPFLSCEPLNVKCKLLYYMVKIFERQKLARKQIVRTRYKDQSVTVNLIHLWRFFRPLPDRVKQVTALLCDYLHTQFNHLQLLTIIKDRFNLHRKSLFKSVMTAAKDSLCMKTVPYRQVYPDAPITEYLNNKDRGGSEKQLRVVMLTKEYRAEEEKEGEEDVEDGGDDEEVCGLTITSVWNNDQWQGTHSLLDEVYRMICGSGEGGVQISHLMSQARLTYRMVRNAIKCLVRLGKVKDILKSSGIHRYSVYVAQPFLEVGSKSFGKALSEFQRKTTELRTASPTPQLRPDTPDTNAAKAAGSSDGPGGRTGRMDQQATQPSRPCQLLDQSDEVLVDMHVSGDRSLQGVMGMHGSKQARITDVDSADRQMDVNKEVCSEKDKCSVGQTTTIGTASDEALYPSNIIADEVVGQSGQDINEEARIKSADHNDVGGNDELAANLPDIECSVVEGLQPDQYRHMALPITCDRVTERMLMLANALLDSLKQCRLLDCVAATKRAIVKQLSLTSTILSSTFPVRKKKRKGEGEGEEEICRKTVTRIVEWCERENKLKTFSVELKYQKKVVKFLLVCAADVEKDDPIVLRAIQQHKLRNFAFTATKEIRKLKPVTLLDWSQMVCCATRAVNSFDPRQYQVRMNKWKKWQKAWWLHRFAWYVMHGYQGNTASQPMEVLQGGVSGAEERIEPPVYLDTDDWRRYVPPVKRHTVEGVSQEVCTIGDLLMVMPLSIFGPLTNSQEIPIVKEFLSDQQRRHYPVTAVPLKVLGSMLQRRIYISPMLDVFRNLCALGLMAVGPMLTSPNRSKQPVYVRKTALLLDTRDSLPGNLFTVLPPGVKEFSRMTFDLNTMDDLLRYWATLQTVAFNTNLNNIGITDKMTADSEEVHPMKLCMAYRPFTEITPHYCLPGNRLGAAGTDSGLFIHMRRNWSIEQIKRADGLGKKNQRGIDRGQLTASIAAVGRQLIKAEPSPSSQKKSSAKPSAAPAPAPAAASKHAGPSGVRRGHWTVHQNSFYPLLAKYRTPRIGKRAVKERDIQKKKGRSIFDAVDMQASQLMKGRRTRFSPKEISVMLLGKVGLTYLCGESANQSYYVPIRDILHQRVPSSRDKATAAIYYCIHRQMKRPNVRLSMAHYLLSIMNNKELDGQYQMKLKVRSRITDDHATIIRNLISQLIDKFTVFEMVHCGGVLPRSLPLLEARYQVMLPDEGRKFTPFTDVSSYTDICSATLRDFQLSHVLSVGDKQMRDYEMFVTLKQYNDQVVTDTFTRLVHRGLLSRNKKYMDGSRMTGIARYMLNYKYQVILQSARQPVSLFSSSAQLLASLTAAAEGLGGGQDVTSPFYRLPQGTATTGHTALVIGLSALDRIHMRLETNAEVINVRSSKDTCLKGRISLGKGNKRSRAASVPDSNEERKSDDSNDDEEEQEEKECQTAEPQVKRRRKDKGDSTSQYKETPTSPTTTPSKGGRCSPAINPPSHPGADNPPFSKSRRRKHLEPFSDSSSEDSDEGGFTPPPKMRRVVFSRPASDAGGLFVTRLQAGEGVRDEGEGGAWLDSRGVSVHFCCRTGLQPVLNEMEKKKWRSSVASDRASFTLLALRRSLPHCTLDPRLSTSANRLTLSLSHLAIALKDHCLPFTPHQLSSWTKPSSSLLVHNVEKSSRAKKSAAMLRNTDVAGSPLMVVSHPQPAMVDTTNADGFAAPQPAMTAASASRSVSRHAGEGSLISNSTSANPEASTEPATGSVVPTLSSDASSSTIPEAVLSTSMDRTAAEDIQYPSSITARADMNIAAGAGADTEKGPLSCPVPEWALPCHSGVSSVVVDREVMRRVVRRETRLLPMEVDWEGWWEQCRASMDEAAYTACQTTCRHVVSAGPLGATWKQLKASVALPVHILYDSLQYLVSHNVVVRSGVTVYRYISLSNARSWLVHTLKNTRGRSSIPPDDQSDQLPPLEDVHRELSATASKGSGLQGKTTEDPAHSITSHGADGQSSSAQQASAGGSSTAFSGEWTDATSTSSACDSSEQGQPELASEAPPESQGGDLASSTHRGRVGDSQRTSALANAGEGYPLHRGTKNPVESGSSRDAQNSGSKDPEDESEKGPQDADTMGGTVEEGPQGGSGPDTGSGSADCSQTGSSAKGQRKAGRRQPAKKYSSEKEKVSRIQPSSTYAKIRLQSRSWRRPEGGLNGPLLSEFLRSLLFLVMKKPGCTLRSLGQHYHLLFSPVDLRDLLQILEDIGCVRMTMMPQRSTPPSLFSPRPSMHVITGPDLLGASAEELMVEATVDCTHRLGQFFSFLGTRGAAASSCHLDHSF